MIRRNSFKKKIRRKYKQFKIFLSKHKRLAYFFIFIFFSFFVIKIAINHYINVPKNLVKNIYFDKKYLSSQDLSGLLLTSNQIFSGTNTIKNKFFHYQKQKEILLSRFPYLDKIQVKNLNSNSIQVNFTFKKPLFYFIGSGSYFLVFGNNQIFRFSTGIVSFINLSKIPSIYLPKYLLNKEKLKNIFWKTKLDKFYQFVSYIHKKRRTAKVFYLAGGEYLKVIYKGKIYYFSFQFPIEEQFNKLNLVQIKKNSDFIKASEIDLGSLNNGVYLKISKNESKN